MRVRSLLTGSGFENLVFVLKWSFYVISLEKGIEFHFVADSLANLTIINVRDIHSNSVRHAGILSHNAGRYTFVNY